MEETKKQGLEQKVLKAGAIIKINVSRHKNTFYYVVNVDSSEIKTLELTQENLTSPHYYYTYFLKVVYWRYIDIVENLKELEIKKDSFVDKNACDILRKYIT